MMITPNLQTSSSLKPYPEVPVEEEHVIAKETKLEVEVSPTKKIRAQTSMTIRRKQNLN